MNKHANNNICRLEYDIREDSLAVLLHADPTNGTTPAAIVGFLQSLNFTVMAKAC